MKNKYIIIILTVLLNYCPIFGIDTLSIIKITNITKPAKNVIEFDLKIYRISDKWNKFANASFVVILDSNEIPKNQENIGFEFLSKNTICKNVDSLKFPMSDYVVKTQSMKNILYINILGPDGFNNCANVELDSFIVISRFRITFPEKINIPTNLSWKEPYNKYQAISYKLDKDSLVKHIPFRYFNDNIEMRDLNHNTDFSLLVEDYSEPKFKMKNFIVEYAGSKVVLINFETETEYQNEGFILLRNIKKSLGNNIIRTDTIFSYKTNINYIGLGTNSIGKKYKEYADTVPYNNYEYCYTLYNQFWDNTITEQGYDCVFVPRTIISYAQANPNPFTNNSIIEYFIEDDAFITFFIRDLEGKEILKISDDKLTKMGKHSFVLDASYLASAGYYEIHIIAKPNYSSNSELSQAVIKVQVIK